MKGLRILKLLLMLLVSICFISFSAFSENPWDADGNDNGNDSDSSDVIGDQRGEGTKTYNPEGDAQGFDMFSNLLFKFSFHITTWFYSELDNNNDPTPFRADKANRTSKVESRKYYKIMM